MSSDVIAITGGSGFIGLSLIEHLLRAGHTVLAHSMDPLPAQALSEFARLPGQLTTVQGDIRDPQFKQCLGDHSATHLFHGAVITAAQAREKVATREILDVNLMGTVNALDACVHAGVRRVVLASSSAESSNRSTSVPSPGSIWFLMPSMPAINIAAKPR